jgi:hypothetical protein
MITDIFYHILGYNNHPKLKMLSKDIYKVYNKKFTKDDRIIMKAQIKDKKLVHEIIGEILHNDHKNVYSSAVAHNSYQRMLYYIIARRFGFKCKKYTEWWNVGICEDHNCIVPSNYCEGGCNDYFCHGCDCPYDSRGYGSEYGCYGSGKLVKSKIILLAVYKDNKYNGYNTNDFRKLL